ncbi:MAG: DUF4386 family protein [Anaerolineales bacterium]|nr:DUF4386 family protein [Anaerolineales bacterium]
MSQSIRTQISNSESAAPHWKALYRAGGVAALVQLGCVLITLIVATTLGVEPTTPSEYFTGLGQDRLVTLLRLDFPSLIHVALFAVTSCAVFAALQENKRMYAGLGVGLVFTGVVLVLAKHSAFSMIHLADQYAAATTEAQRTLLLAAGEAVIASDWWHSTGGFFAGLFLQGGTVLISCIMLRSEHFSKATAWTGILANGLDWIHVLIQLVSPGLAAIVLAIGGLFYVAWYPLLARDFLRLGKHA